MRIILGKIKLSLANFLIPFASMFLVAQPCFAINSSIALKADKTDLVAGDEITITADLPDENKIYALTATLQYDRNIFEPIDADDFAMPEAASLSYNAENNQFGIINQTGAVSDDLLTIRLQVKSDANVGETNIALSNISTSDGQTKTEYTTAVTRVTVTRDAAEGEVVPTNQANTILETQSEPQNVFYSTPFIIGAIVAVIIIACFIAYHQSRINPETVKLHYALTALAVIIVAVVIGILAINNGKKDLDGNGVIDYGDAEDIIGYLINLEGQDNQESDENSSAGASSSSGSSAISYGGSSTRRPNSATSAATSPNNPSASRRPEDYDTNNDGKVDINDAGHNAEQAQKETKVEISNANADDYYVEKGNHEIKFIATVQPDNIAVSKVKIGENYYEAVPSEGGGNLYAVKVDPMTAAGKKDFKINEVETTNGKILATNHILKYEVLKSLPQVINFSHELETRKISFNIYDADRALQGGKANLYSDNNLENAIKSQLVNQTETTEIQSDNLSNNRASYYLEVTGDYCRVEDVLDTKYCEKNSVFHAQKFTMSDDYKFELNNFSLSDYVEPGNNPIINFDSSNSNSIAINAAKVVIDDSEYDFPVALAADGTFQVVLDRADMTPGVRHKVSLKSVTLADMTTFINPEDFIAGELSYFVPKDVPTITNLKLSDEKDNQKIKAAFDLSDKNSAVSQLTIIMIDAGENVVAKNVISREQLQNDLMTTELDYSKAQDKAFTIQILADYDLGDKYNFSQVNLAEGDIAVYEEGKMYVDQSAVATAANIANNNTAKITRYAEKNQKNFGLAFKFVKADGYNLPTKCGGSYPSNTAYTVNGNNYAAFGLGNNLQGKGYNTGVILGVPDQAGVVDLAVTRTQFARNDYYHQCSDWFSIPKITYQFEVLRDAPKVENLRITSEDYASRTATFEFDLVVDPSAQDDDESFTSGVLKLGSREAAFNARGHNIINLTDIPTDEKLELDIQATYDRDSDYFNDAKTDENQVNNGSIFKTTYGLFSPETYGNVKVENSEALTNSKENNDNYFEKREEVGLYFELTGLSEEFGKPVAAILDNKKGKTYELVQVVDNGGQAIQNSYAIFVPGYADAGGRSLTITSVVLENGKELSIDHPEPIYFEILKNVPTISDAKFERKGAEIKIESVMNDSDSAIVGTPQAIVSDEDGEEVYRGPYSNKITAKNNGNLRYYIKIVGDYNRTSSLVNNLYQANLEQGVTLLDTMFSLANNKIELKNITDINLYEVTSNNQVKLLGETSKNDINASDGEFFLEIAMDGTPTTRIPIKQAEEIDNHLYLVLNSDNITFEAGSIDWQVGLDGKIRVDFGELQDGKAKNEFHPDVAFQKLLDKLNAGADVELDRDYDASAIKAPTSTSYIENYGGHFNGNGHTIKNLTTPLFNNLTPNAKIENLVLSDVVLNNNGHGALANTAEAATIQRISIKNFENKSVPGKGGSLVGQLKNSIIEEVGVNNAIMKTAYLSQQVGGIVGRIESSSIKNSYIIGALSADWNFVGSLVGGGDNNVTLENNYTKVTYNQAWNYVSCGFGCTSAVAKHNIALNTLNASVNTAFMSGLQNGSTDNYYLESANKAIPEDQRPMVETITAKDVNRELFEQAEYDSKVWRFDSSTSLDSLPRLKFEKQSSSHIEEVKDYNPSKITLYNNAGALAPYYEVETIVKDANKLNNSELASKKIQTIAPVDANGNFVSYLTSDNPGKIARLRVIFDDGSHDVYDVDYDKTYDMVASYRISELHLDYNFPSYVIDANSRTVDNLTYYLKNLNYTSNLDNLTAAAEGRILRDFYQDTTSKELKEFVLKYLSASNYAVSSSSEAINAQIERAVKQNNKIEKALYAYNYFRRLYNVDIDNMKLYDYVLFGMRGLNDKLATENIVDALFADSDVAASATFNTGSTNNTYMSVLAKYAGKANLANFLEFVVQGFGHGQTMDEWVHSQFKGFLSERSIDSRFDYNSDTGVIQKSSNTADTNTLYTLWDHFSHSHQGNEGGYRVYNFILPILTLPENSTYIISSPVQFVIGSQRTYIQYRNPTSQEAFNFRVKSYADRMQTYFKTAYGILQDPNIFNNIHMFQLDKSSMYSSDDSGVNIFQRPGSTTDPHFMNFNEIVNLYPASAGNNAASWGAYTEFQAAGVMDANIKEVADYLGIPANESTFGTWSHETAHSIDSLLWMRGKGRRWNSGGEDYADGNLRQEFNGNLIVMNVVKDWGENCGYASNCSPDRIDSQEEIKDFYSKAFDVIYTIDYLQAQAFLELDNFSKSQIGTQISYPNEEKYIDSENPNEKASAYGTTRYSWLTEEEWKNLPLDDIEDLYDNKIMVYPGYYKQTSRGAGSYGGEGINVAHWYQPHNYFGLPDSYSLKWLAYEMMSVGGYDDGYIKYNSNIDSITLPYKDQDGKDQKITGYKTDAVINEITGFKDFDSYKKSRFAQIEQKLEHLNEVIDVKKYIQELYDAMVLDAKEQKDNVQAKFDGAGGEEKCLNTATYAGYWCMHGWQQGQPGGWYGVLDYVSQPHTTAVRHQIYQTLKNLSRDFLDNDVIYNDSFHQDVQNLRQSIKHKTAEEVKNDQEFSDNDINESGGEQPEDKDDIEDL